LAQAARVSLGRVMAPWPVLPPREQRLGPIGVCWLRREGAPRAPLAVVLCPGNPSANFGSSHAGAPLITALVNALVELRVPVVTFDYKGVGISGAKGTNPNPKTWRVPSDENAAMSVNFVLHFVKEQVSDNAVIVGYSYGSSQALKAVLEGACYAFVSISIGTRIWMFTPDPAVQETMKRDMEGHSSVTCKSLYIIGEKDRLSPRREVEELIGGREGVELKVIPQGVHHFEGHEDEVGVLCAKWVEGLRQELPVEKDAPPEEEPRTAQEEDEEEGEEELKASEEELKTDGREDVKIIGNTCTNDSAVDFFYVTLPAGSTLAALRAAVGEFLEPGIEVFQLVGMSKQKLEEDDPVPAEVMVKELKWKIPPNGVLTQRQARKAHIHLLRSMRRRDLQNTLDVLEEKANGNTTKYRVLLLKELSEKVYPPILNLFGLPCSGTGIQVLSSSIAHRATTLPMVQNWLKIETLMRNKQTMVQAENAIYAFKSGLTQEYYQ